MSKDQVKFDSSYYSPTFINEFMDDFRACNHNVLDWSLNKGVYIDWDDEERLAQEHAARKASKNSSSSTAGWEQRRRR